MSTIYYAYTNEQDSDQNYGPYVRWEFDSRQPDPRNGETEEREFYIITLEAPEGSEKQYRELVERKLNADRCVVFWGEQNA